MKLLPIILHGLLSAAHASTYKHASVLPDVLSEDSTAALAGQVGANRLLRSGADGDDNGSYRQNRWRGEATVSANDIKSLIEAIGDTRSAIEPKNLRATIITGNTDYHTDFKVGDGKFEEDEKVVFVFLEDNEEAYFEIGEDRIPVTKGTMVAFEGQSVSHKTVVPSGTEVRLLGPFATRDLQEVEGYDMPPPTPPCSVDVKCEDVCFNAIEEEECPHGAYFAFEYMIEKINAVTGLQVSFSRGCDENVPLGELCEADGECGSNNRLNNCGFLQFHGYNTIMDIYRRVECCPEVPPCSFVFCRRRLRDGEEDPVKEDLPLKEVHAIIDAMRDHGAKHDSSFSFMYDLISKESCEILIEEVESSLAIDRASGRDLPIGTASDDGMEENYESWLEFADGGLENQYDKKLYADDLVRMIGKEETLKIIDFFEDSLDGLTIDCMYLSRHGNGDHGDDKYMVPWHMDDYATLEITLNDDYHGGHVLHLNSDGVHKTHARPGSATAHMNDIVHGITPNKGGAKYMLILKHHFNRPDKAGVVRLSRDIVNKINPSLL
eukprot:CAMPEP_0181099146 /NCGR_PEP_ID=MMETSP1071-20121207/12504_1 /TAXON_ID=35127 /ORGANISM="Thalassiosira sp., Strain NH16" /LENGTH=549 /DNA_ID=CAMNT_0023181789 /DNA_START=133 /DNA_END=1779 /DNA_ORIENTATION=+